MPRWYRVFFHWVVHGIYPYLKEREHRGKIVTGDVTMTSVHSVDAHIRFFQFHLSLIYKWLVLGIAISVTCAWTGTAFTEFATIMHIIGTIGMECPAHTIYRILWIAPDQNDKFRFYPLLFAFRHFWFPLIGKNLPHKKSKLSTESEQVGYFP